MEQVEYSYHAIDPNIFLFTFTKGKRSKFWRFIRSAFLNLTKVKPPRCSNEYGACDAFQLREHWAINWFKTMKKKYENARLDRTHSKFVWFGSFFYKVLSLWTTAFVFYVELPHIFSEYAFTKMFLDSTWYNPNACVLFQLGFTQLNRLGHLSKKP